MRTTPVNDFIKYVVPQADGCPDFVARREIVATIADICRETGCVTAETNLITRAGVAEYDIPIDEGLQVEYVRNAFCDGMELRPVRLDELTRDMVGTDWFNKTGTPLYYTFKRKNQIRFIPRPEAALFVRLDVVVTVDRETRQVPEQFFTDWLDTVVAGALSRIFRIAGQLYSNTQLAERNLVLYQQGLCAIRGEAVRDFTRTTGRVKFNRIV